MSFLYLNFCNFSPKGIILRPDCDEKMWWKRSLQGQDSLYSQVRPLFFRQGEGGGAFTTVFFKLMEISLSFHILKRMIFNRGYFLKVTCVFIKLHKRRERYTKKKGCESIYNSLNGGSPESLKYNQLWNTIIMSNNFIQPRL